MASRCFHSVVLSLVALAVSGTVAMAHWAPNGIPVCVAAGPQANVRAASDNAGGAILVWEDSRSGTTDIYAMRVLSSGLAAAGWTAQGTAVCTAANSQQAPDIVADNAGGAFVLWTDYRSPSHPKLYLQRLTANGGVASGWPVTEMGMAVCDSVQYPFDPALIADGAGGVIVAWEDYRGTSADIYAMRINGSGSRLWRLRGERVCVATGDQLYPVCATDGSGGAFIAWQDSRAVASTDIYLQHLGSSGDIASGVWPQDGISLTPTTGLRSAYVPTIVSDFAGGAITVWEDYRNGNDSDIYAQRINTTGARAAGWADGGTVVCNASQGQTEPIVVSDGANGAIAVWVDLRGSAKDLYAQRMTGAGARAAGWPTSGFAVCTAAGDQASPRAVPDGANGAIVTWYDFRGGSDTDIYAQHVTGAGAVGAGWTVDGDPVCTALADQQSPTLVNGSDGRAVIAWHDNRNSSTGYDVYAQSVTGGGDVLDVPQAAPVSFRLHEPRPNPAAGPVSLAFELPVAQVVGARVFDLAGRSVRTLEAGRLFPAGTHSLSWDGRDEGGAPAAAGVYLVRLGAGSDVQVRRVVRLR
jgi:hypothetical protein